MNKPALKLTFLTRTNRLKLVLNSNARAITNTLKFHRITRILEYLHWLKINERIKYKVFTLPRLKLTCLCWSCVVDILDWSVVVLNPGCSVVIVDGASENIIVAAPCELTD